MNKNRNRIAAMMMVAAITVSSVAIPVEAAVVNSNVSSKVVENTRGAEKDVTDGVVLNEENFPDVGFRKYLSDRFKIKENEKIPDNILQEKEMYVSKDRTEETIKDLTGIEYFKKLESLYCSNQQIKNIDLSNNTELEKFICDGNNIKNLNLEKNTKLQKLECQNNIIENISILNLNNLDFLNCSGNNIKNIDLTTNKNLIYLKCSDNNISKLDLSENLELISLECNKNKLLDIDLSKNLKLEGLSLENNDLEKINIENNMLINSIRLSYNKLKTIDLSKNKKLGLIELRNNKLRSLDLSNAENLDISPSEPEINGNEIGKLEFNEYKKEGRNYHQSIDLSNNKFDNYIDLNKEFGITQEDINNNKVDVKTEGIILDGTKLRWKDNKPFEIKYIYNCGGKNNKIRLDVNLYLGEEYNPSPSPNPDDNKPITPSTPSVKPDTNHSKIVGGDRYETAAKIADQMGSYDTVILVNSDKSMADGLSAASLSGKKNAPILLVKKDNIPKSTMDRINRAKNVYIIGGENTISKKVENQLENKNITRIAGKDRYDTSKKIAAMLGGYEKAFIVNGVKGEADAMSVSAAAAKYGAPILLTNGKTSIHENKDGVQYFAIGGRAVVSNELADKYSADRIAGVDRYATNKKIMDEFYYESKKVYFAKGDTLVDALTASTLAKDNGIVLVSKKSNHTLLNGKETVQVGGMDFTINFK